MCHSSQIDSNCMDNKKYMNIFCTTLLKNHSFSFASANNWIITSYNTLNDIEVDYLQNSYQPPQIALFCQHSYSLEFAHALYKFFVLFWKSDPSLFPHFVNLQRLLFTTRVRELFPNDEWSALLPILHREQKSTWRGSSQRYL